MRQCAYEARVCTRPDDPAKSTFPLLCMGLFSRFLPKPLGRQLTMTGLDTWYGYMKSHDGTELWDLLHPKAVVESPVVHSPQRGRDITFKSLSSAEKVLGGPGFTYVGEWKSANGAVLEFKNVIDGIEINGVDIITFDSEGRITHFKVMVRPLKAINMLHRLMAEQLAAAQS